MARSDFNFTQFSEDTILMTNYAGRHVFLKSADFNAFCKGYPTDKTVQILKNNLFYSDCDRETFMLNYAGAIRDYRDYLFSGTALHIFVLTSQCNLKCVYCQASTCNDGKMMSKETAEKCIDLALQSPCRNLSFEFQGGEPLANFETLKHIVLYTELHKCDKIINYNLVSNLTMLTDEMIDFILNYNISVSTSLDGGRELQNRNRPLPGGDSYQLWKEKYTKLKRAIPYGIGAIETTTKFSLEHPEDIVDEYITNGFNRVFIRPLTPLGYAAARWDEIGYTADEFLCFYDRAFNHIFELSAAGVNISEGHASIFLDKIINHKAGNYTELRSPCGAGLGQLAYNYDGRIYTCDEGRMLAEMGDNTFQVGTVNSQYSDLCNCDVCKAVATASCLESVPQCAECVYAPYCGVCPVLNYYDNHNIFAAKPNHYKCRIYKGMLDIIFAKLNKCSQDEYQILNRWI